jgi:hypothetical protein
VNSYEQAIRMDSILQGESINFDRNPTIDYFKKELAVPGSGGRHLVESTFYRGNIPMGGIPGEDIEICLQMAILVSSLTTRQNQLFGNFMNLLMKKVETIRTYNTERSIYDFRSRYKCPNCKCSRCQNEEKEREEERKCSDNAARPKIPTLPPIPRNFEQIRATILTGAKSFIPKLPRPIIRRKGNHAYVLPSECIKIFIASGNVPMEFNCLQQSKSYTSPRETPRGVAIAKKISGEGQIRHIPLSYIEWRDDCESTKSNKTSKTGSLWVWTMTIFEKEKKMIPPGAPFQ